MYELIVLLRILFAIIVVLLLPGYTFSIALFPRTESINSVQRLAISGILGLVISIIIGTLLIEFGIGLFLDTYLLANLIITCLGIFIVLVRWMLFGTSQQFDGNSLYKLISRSFKFGNRRNMLAGMLGIIVLLSFIISILPSNQPSLSEQYTEFFLLDVNNKLPSYPLFLPGDGILTLNVGIINHETLTRKYQINVEAEGNLLFSSQIIKLDREQRWENEIEFNFSSIEENHMKKIEILLYMDDNPDAYRELHLWMGNNT